MSWQQQLLHLGFFCPIIQLGASGEGTSGNSYEIMREERHKAMPIYMEHEHHMFLGAQCYKQVEPHQLSQPHSCHVIAASSGPETVLLHTKKTTCARPRQGMSAAHSCPPHRHAFIVSTQFCYPGAVGYFLQSHLLPPEQRFSLIWYIYICRQ